MTYSNNDLISPLICSSSNHPIISFSAYARNKYNNFDCDCWVRHLYDKYKYLSEICNNYKVEVSSTTYNQIEVITNKYIADKRIYIPGITTKSYLYSLGEYGKSIDVYDVIKLMFNSEKKQFSFLYNPYPCTSEYTVQNYKSDMENLYKKIISEKILNSYITQNNSTKQRNNNQEEMSCFKFIADRNKSNTNKKFHK